MKQFVPYENEADVLQIGQLMIENRLDRVTLNGDVDLTADQAGLADARALFKLLGDVVARLEARSEAHDLPDKLAPPANGVVANPFE